MNININKLHDNSNKMGSYCGNLISFIMWVIFTWSRGMIKLSYFVTGGKRDLFGHSRVHMYTPCHTLKYNRRVCVNQSGL